MIASTSASNVCSAGQREARCARAASEFRTTVVARQQRCAARRPCDEIPFALLIGLPLPLHFSSGASSPPSRLAVSKRRSGKPLLQNPVALLVALGLTNSGESWRPETFPDSYILLKRQVLTVSGSYWRNRRDGLKGRCSTTELRPYGVNSQV
jgi:hypothetical protein